MSEDKNEKLPKFDGTGYTLWKRRMVLVFAHHELLDVVEMDSLTINPTADFLKKDYPAKYLYQACVSDEVFEEICDCEYATEMHTALDEKYNIQSVAETGPVANGTPKGILKVRRDFCRLLPTSQGNTTNFEGLRL
jgi:hypothetical protein